MSVPLLSICIPTFNREVYLRECLKSLKRSWVFDVEVVVSDNASTDGTLTVLEDYAHELPLRWQQQPTNLGFDRNCASVVSMARGRYCWLLGSDDCISIGALEQIMSLLRQHHPDIFHFGYVQADLALLPLSRSMPPASATPIVMTAIEVPKYLSALQNVSLAFAFISCFIFRREKWITHLYRLPAWLDSHYVHAYMLHAMLAAGARVFSSDECFVIARGGNANEWNVKPASFLRLDATTLLRIHREIYSDALHLEAFGKIFRRSYTTSYIVRIAAHGGLSQLLLCRTEIVALGHSLRLIQFLQLIDWLRLMPALAGLIALRRYFLNNFRYIRTYLSK